MEQKDQDSWSSDPYLDAALNHVESLKRKLSFLRDHGDEFVPEQTSQTFVMARWEMAVIECMLTKAVDSIAVPGLARTIHAAHDAAYSKRFLASLGDLVDPMLGTIDYGGGEVK